MKLVEGVRKDAEQKYGKERVYAILMRDNVLGMKYLIPICRFVYDEGVDVNEVFAILNRLGNRKIGNIWAMSFQEMKQAYEMNYPCDVIPLPNPVFCSSDNMVEIGQIKTWDEARKIPMCRSWCISRGKDSWEDYTINRHYRFYIIRNLRNSHNKSARYVLLAIAPNGAYDFSDSTDTNIVDGCIIPDFYKHHFMPSEYKDAIGEEGVSAIEKIIGRKISESKIMKNMKTNKRTITESHPKTLLSSIPLKKPS